MLSISDANSQFHLRITGLLDLEGYYLDQPASGLIDTDDNLLFNPRLTIFVDARWSEYLYFYGQVRLDRGFDPSDEGAQVRLDEYFLRYKPFGNARLNFQIGKVCHRCRQLGTTALFVGKSFRHRAITV